MNRTKKNKVYRQSRSNRFVHWMTALSIFALIISGFGQMPMYKRYNITKLPGAEWLGEYSLTLVMHYLAAIVLVLIVFYHIFVHLLQKQFDALPKRGDGKESIKIIKAMITKGEEPPSEKYLAEQRLAYAAIGLTVLALIGTGFIKMAKNVALITIPHTVVFWSTTIHNIATFILLFLIISHLAAFVIKANRKLLPGMFTGYVDEEYVKERHSLWYEKIKEKKTQ
ncbi:cytochrome b/b6 domain-containing protein [Bacillus sp. B15-48]|uniref:formate dehydrogenase subunit gamma n=1 Tax=Bacillus sp. B15-48 TaxID=1548601 RepID=UPI00193F1425|nr:cytochrome b/b6 domain-containing protein [Bacillus sp. B15-48]MBM4765403.1 cytochrome b/b6 domain-containing protein [Bacillus sp. B15-48]